MWSLPRVLFLSLVLSACSPTLNWREVDVAAQTRMQFPCRPELAERSMVQAGVTVPVRMAACEAGGLSWSATVFEVRDPARLTATLRELRLALVARLGGGDVSARPVRIAGMTPSDEALRVTIARRQPDRSDAVPQAEAVFVARGLQVFQFVVMARPGGSRPWAGSADEFLGSVRWPG